MLHATPSRYANDMKYVTYRDTFGFHARASSRRCSSGIWREFKSGTIISHQKRRRLRNTFRDHVCECRIVNVIQHERGTRILLSHHDTNVIEMNVPRMANVQRVRGQYAEHTVLGIFR